MCRLTVANAQLCTAVFVHELLYDGQTVQQKCHTDQEVLFCCDDVMKMRDSIVFCPQHSVAVVYSTIRRLIYDRIKSYRVTDTLKARSFTRPSGRHGSGWAVKKPWWQICADLTKTLSSRPGDRQYSWKRKLSTDEQCRTAGCFACRPLVWLMSRTIQTCVVTVLPHCIELMRPDIFYVT